MTKQSIDKIEKAKLHDEGLEHAADVPEGGLPEVTEFPTYGMEMTKEEMILVRVFPYLTARL